MPIDASTPRNTVQVVQGDMFASDAQTLVNTVNTVGVMGKGVALEFKKRFPDMYEDYRERCARKEVRLGEPYLYKGLFPPCVLNFPTKDHWKSVSRLVDILRGLDHLERNYRDWGVTSLACPPLGCGYGGLEWRVVGPTLYRRLSRLEIPVLLYAPFGTPHEELQPTYLAQGEDEVARGEQREHFAPSRIDPAWVALVGILKKLEANPYHWPVGRISFQKLAYFATDAGLPTGMHFVRGSYGPWAEGLKGIQGKLVNNGLISEERLGNMIAYRVGPTFEAAARAFEHELGSWDELSERLASLMSRMRTKDAEMAATVHFAAKELEQRTGAPPRERDVLAEVMEWKKRRDPAWDPQEVAETIRQLGMKSWLHVKPSDSLPVDELSEVGFRAKKTARRVAARKDPSLF